jgi:hypothetical protein
LSGRVVGAGDEHHVRPAVGDGGDGGIDVEAEVVGADSLEPVGVSAVGNDRVHREGRHESDRAAARAAERLQQLLQDLVGTVGRPEVFQTELGAGLRGEVAGQITAQGHRVAVGVTVQVGGRLLHRPHHVVDQRPGGRVWILVGVQPHRNRQLRCTIG